MHKMGKKAKSKKESVDIEVNGVQSYLAVVQSLNRTSKSLVDKSLHLLTPG